MEPFQSRFGAAAGAYRSFRPIWPEEVFQRIHRHARAPRKRAVDLGAGTGLVALRLLETYDEVLAVEPDEKMLAQLESSPRKPGSGRLRPLQVRAEDALIEPASADLVTAGNAFHWMEGRELCERVRAWLRPDGAFCVFRYDPPHAAEGPLGPVLAAEYTGPWDRHVHPRLRDPDYSRRTLAGSSFAATLEVVRLSNPLSLELDELLGFCRSTSYGGGYARSLPDPESYWRDLRARIAASAGPGPYRLDFHIELVLATKGAGEYPALVQNQGIHERMRAFLAEGPWAVVGATTDRSKYGNKVLRCYVQSGKTPVYPVNPRATEVEGLSAYPSLTALPEPARAVSIITPPAITEAVVEEAARLGIRYLWMQPGAESPRALALAEQHGLEVIAGGPCLLVVLGYRE